MSQNFIKSLIDRGRSARFNISVKVLLADDDKLDRRALKEVLEAGGYQVDEAADGAEAWAMYDRKPYRVVVSDWMMPKVNGLDLCRKIRERPRTGYTYFMLITGTMIGEENYRAAMDAGVDDFLTKPPDREMVWMRMRVAERIMSLAIQVSQLEGLIPVCMYCKRIRREEGGYVQMEEYIEDHSLASFTHGVCPDCMDRKFPGLRQSAQGKPRPRGR
jgi:phosphoserine phosphatase RsbU/P